MTDWSARNEWRTQSENVFFCPFIFLSRVLLFCGAQRIQNQAIGGDLRTDPFQKRIAGLNRLGGAEAVETHRG
jgi:hypothetical protein